jgi:hypothetical protein
MQAARDAMDLAQQKYNATAKGSNEEKKANIDLNERIVKLNETVKEYNKLEGDRKVLTDSLKTSETSYWQGIVNAVKENLQTMRQLNAEVLKNKEMYSEAADAKWSHFKNTDDYKKHQTGADAGIPTDMAWIKAQAELEAKDRAEAGWDTNKGKMDQSTAAYNRRTALIQAPNTGMDQYEQNRRMKVATMEWLAEQDRLVASLEATAKAEEAMGYPQHSRDLADMKNKLALVRAEYDGFSKVNIFDQIGEGYRKFTDGTASNALGASIRQLTDDTKAFFASFDVSSPSAFWDSLKEHAKTSAASVKQSMNEIVAANPKLRADIQSGLQSSLGTFFEDVMNRSKSAKDMFKDFAKSVISDLIKIQAQKMAMSLLSSSGGQGSVNLITSFMGAGSGGSSLAGAFADGGTVYPGGTYLVGERGPELFQSSGAGTVIPNHALKAAVSGNTGGNGGNVHLGDTHVNVTADTGLTATQISGLRTEIRQEQAKVVETTVTRKISEALRPRGQMNQRGNVG